MYKTDLKNGQNNVYMQNILISCDFLYSNYVYCRIDIEVSKSAGGSNTVISKPSNVNHIQISHTYKLVTLSFFINYVI